jgi:hypothetical protein
MLAAWEAREQTVYAAVGVGGIAQNGATHFSILMTPSSKEHYAASAGD